MAVAATSEMDKDLEDQANALTSCPICMDPFETPKALPCQHTFCLACIESVYESANKQRAVAVSNFPCPTCRAVCYVPRLGLNSLPTDFKVEQIRELMKAMAAATRRGSGQSPGSTSVGKTELSKRNSQLYDGAMCAVCRVLGNDKLASGFCADCTKHFCKDCSNNHCKNPLFSSHSVLPISPASTDAGGWRCEEHQSEMTYYCDKCSKPACMLCVTCSHEGHPVLGRAEAMNSVKAKAKECVEVMDGKVKEFDAKIDTVRRLKQEQTKSYKEMEKAIKKAVKEMEQKLKDLERETMGNLKVDYDAKLQAMAATEKLFQERQKVAKGLSGQLEDLAKNQNIKLVLSSYSGLEDKVNTEISSPCDITPNLFEYLSFQPDNQLTIGNMENKVFASEQRKAQMAFQKDQIKSSSSSKSSSGSKFKGLRASFRKGKASGSAAPETSSGQSTPTVPGTPVSLRADISGDSESGKTTTLKRQAFLEQLRRLSNASGATTPSPARVLDSPVDRFQTGPNLPRSTTAAPTSSTTASTLSVATQPLSARRPVGGQTFNGRSMWRKEGFVCCRDCCFTVEGQVAAAEYGKTGQERVRIYSERGDLLHSIESILISEPWAICFNSATSSLLITDHGGSTSSIKSVKIAALRDVTTFKCGSAVDRPSGIAFLSSGDIVLTETGKRKNRAGIFSMLTNSGRLSKIREFGTKGQGDGEVQQANYVAVNHEDHIILADTENHHIKIFSNNGKQLLKFSVSVDGVKDMVPQGVAVDQYNNIFVADQASQGVLKFDQDGIQIGDVMKTRAMPWGLSFCAQKNRLSVAMDSGVEVFQLY